MSRTNRKITKQQSVISIDKKKFDSTRKIRYDPTKWHEVINDMQVVLTALILRMNGSVINVLPLPCILSAAERLLPVSSNSRND